MHDYRRVNEQLRFTLAHRSAIRNRSVPRDRCAAMAERRYYLFWNLNDREQRLFAAELRSHPWSEVVSDA